MVNHAKIATVETASGLKFLLRGSMNLNFNPRFEQFDMTEGGPEFDLVKGIEDELPVLDDGCSGKEVYEGSKLDNGFGAEQPQFFENSKPWKPSSRRPNSPPQLDRFRVRQILEEVNPGAKVDDVEFYTHQFLTYIEAAQNVLVLGTIVAHPRNGAPMVRARLLSLEMPYFIRPGSPTTLCRAGIDWRRVLWCPVVRASPRHGIHVTHTVIGEL